MIRHGLTHDTPGYVCPFCPEDKCHRYPRPDNLQRHVRVRHLDKERDDPLLKEVLAQRPTSSALLMGGPSSSNAGGGYGMAEGPHTRGHASSASVVEGRSVDLGIGAAARARGRRRRTGP